MSVSRNRYTAVAIALHWLIALAIITNIGLAWWFNTLVGEAKIPPVQLHKSIGVTVLLLSLIRVAWRLAVRPPPPPAGMPAWQVRVAGLTHFLFYVIMLGMPLSGWAMSSASPLIHVFPITLYNVIPWPTIAPLANLPHEQMKLAHKVFEQTHGLLAKMAYVLIALHVGAALKHQIIDRDGVLGRMLPLPFLVRR